MDILTLAAKDMAVRKFGHLTLNWDNDTWVLEVTIQRNILLLMPHHELEELLGRYPDSPDHRDSDDLPK